MESNIDEYLQKTRSVTQYDLANRFGVRMSVARRILRQKEADGVLVPYIREGGLEVYTTPAELEKRESETPTMIADALEEVASSVPKAAVITEEMDAELIAASGAGSVVKPSRLARKRREAGVKKEKAKAQLPEVIVEPLTPEPEAEEAVVTPEPKPEAKPKAKKPAKKKPEKEAKPKKKVTKKKVAAAKPKAKKPVTKKTAKKTEAKPKKTTKKKAEETAKPKAKKTTTKKAKEEAKPKKKVTKKKTEEAKPKKAAAKKTTAKKTEAKPKKTTAKKTTKKKSDK